MIKKTLKGHKFIGILEEDKTGNCMVTIKERETRKIMLDISLDNLEVFYQDIGNNYGHYP